MKKTIILIIFIYTNFLFSQKRTCIIVNDNNNLPVEYCNIKIVNKDIGTYSNGNGYFTFDDNDKDSLFISHILYKEITIAVNSIKDTIKLKSKNQFLDEIIISSNKSYTNWSKKRKDKHHWYIQPKTEFCVLLEKYKKNETLNEIRFPIEYLDYMKSKVVNSSIFRINIYNNTNGNIGNIISITDNITTLTEKSNFIKFTLDKPIEIPVNGFFIGVEFIGFIDDNGTLLLNERNNFIKLDFASTKSSKTFYSNKFINDGLWSLLEKKNDVFPFELKTGLSLIYIYK